MDKEKHTYILCCNYSRLSLILKNTSLIPARWEIIPPALFMRESAEVVWKRKGR